MKQLLTFLVVFLLSVSSVLCQTTGGIGAVLLLDTAKDGTTLPRIKNTVPNSPAAAQSLPEGSYIIEVNELKCRNKSLEEVVAVIRGQVGTTVKITLADNPQGKKSQTYELVRAAIQTGTPPADPVDAFIGWCELETKRIKRQGHAIVKTFTSDCGSFFFSFEGDNSLHHVRLISLEAKTTGTGKIAASLYDTNNEPGAVKMSLTGTRDDGNNTITTLDGTITLKNNSVGVVSTNTDAMPNGAGCKKMYIVVYK